jgi:hypothetical protein
MSSSNKVAVIKVFRLIIKLFRTTIEKMNFLIRFPEVGAILVVTYLLLSDCNHLKTIAIFNTGHLGFEYIDKSNYRKIKRGN